MAADFLITEVMTSSGRVPYAANNVFIAVNNISMFPLAFLFTEMRKRHAKPQYPGNPVFHSR